MALVVPVEMVAMPSAARSVVLIPAQRERVAVQEAPECQVAMVAMVVTVEMGATSPPQAMEPW